MDLRELRTFVAVVEEGRFAGAAQRLKLSQPAISHTISGLEKECGVRLLERTNTGVVMTAAGRVLVTEARAVLARYEEAVAAMTQGGSEDTLLRIGIPFGLPTGLLDEALAELAVAYPAMTVAVRQLCTAGQIAALGAGELDLGLLRHRPANLDLDALLVADEPLGVLVSQTQASKLGPSEDVGLDALVGLALEWHGFPRESSPVWYDELTATLRGYGLNTGRSTQHVDELIPDVIHASLSIGRSFALAPASCQATLPAPITWRRLTGDPLRRRTWASWAAASRRRDLGHLVSLLEDRIGTPWAVDLEAKPAPLARDAQRDALAS